MFIKYLSSFEDKIPRKYQRGISIDIPLIFHLAWDSIGMITFRYRRPLYVSLALVGEEGSSLFAFYFYRAKKGRGSLLRIRYLTLKVKLDRRLYDSAEGRHEATVGRWFVANVDRERSSLQPSRAPLAPIKTTCRLFLPSPSSPLVFVPTAAVLFRIFSFFWRIPYLLPAFSTVSFLTRRSGEIFEHRRHTQNLYFGFSHV